MKVDTKFGVFLNGEKMTEYNVQREICEKCNKINFCIQIYDHKEKDLIFLCDNCFSWAINYHADIKDEIRKMMIECGIEKER